MSGLTESTVDWGLPHSEPPRWLRALDWVRQHVGYRLKMGQRLYDAVGARLPPTLDTRIFPGIVVRVDLGQDVARTTWWSGPRYEAPTPAVLTGWLADGAEQFFDIGANCGWFSYLALSCSEAEVHAFEPRADLIQQLRAAKEVNDLHRFHPHHLGLSDRAGELRLHVAQTQTGYSTLGPHPTLQAEGEMVAIVPFDQWREDAGIELPGRPCWVAKIDVEGFEANVLRGMAKALENKAFSGLAVELNEYTLEFCGSSIDEVIGLLRDNRYVMRRVDKEEGSLNRFFAPE
jgi:FkbM family methyltransferase